MDDFEKRTREAAGDFQRSNGLAIYTDVYTSFVDGAYWARDEMQDEIDRLKRDNDLLYRAKELYGPAGFRHVGSIMNERDRLKAELAAARGEIATLKWHIGNVEGCGKLVVKECEDLKLLLAAANERIEDLQLMVKSYRTKLASLLCGISIKTETAPEYTDCHLCYVDKDDLVEALAALNEEKSK